MRDIECPYCGYDQDIDHDDGYGFGEDEKHQQECDNCEKTFVYTTAIIYHYSPERADCLNGIDHDYHPTHTYPKYATRMMCSMCDEVRQPTHEERIKHGIPKFKET